MATRAQLSQERSRQRRELLLAAAIELFAEGGSRAVTHRAVAAAAGLPPASTTYYFESIEELLRAALADHVARWRHELDQLSGLESMPRAHISVDEATTVIGQVFAARGPDVAARELSILLAVARDDALRDEARATLEGFEELAARWLAILGVPDGERVAPTMLALVAGTALRRQSGQYSEQEEARMLSEGLRDLVGAHLQGREAIDQVIESTIAAATERDAGA
ncbi:TetR/AcrR family transcriptional regulator [Aeromicrobium sp. CTD01-1L150]|uniref:TetR/AcrR family transcriptional regulator n=1 Tax=Aeromicrobium sp. CTD01-1L150 TaxID=3341830 RepID=UPI0035BF601F